MRGALDFMGGNFAPPIDKLLGSAFSVVKTVHDNIDALLQIVTNLDALLAIQAQYTKYQNLLVTQPFLEPLNVTGTNTVSQLTYAYDGHYALVFIDGQPYFSSDPALPFTISGHILTWNPTTSGKTLTTGVTKATIFYTTAAAPIIGSSVSNSFTSDQLQLLALLQSFPTTLPAQPGVLWLDNGVPAISQP